ncbi:MAG: tetratricopeptide repeat protein [Opitutales bacterium]|nr:tetratricopeptide repeat protein [Opitutales bacterium]
MHAIPLRSLLCHGLAFLFAILPLWMAQGSTPDPRSLIEPTESMKEFARKRISKGTVSERLDSLLRELTSPEGLGFTYDAALTLSASEAFEMRRGNCLSFAFLVTALGREIGLNVQFNRALRDPSWTDLGRIVVENHHINCVVKTNYSAHLVELFPEYTTLYSYQLDLIPDEKALADFYNNRAVYHVAAGNMAEAHNLFQTAVNVDPDSTATWKNWSILHKAQGDIDQAETCLQKALGAKGDKASVYYMLSQVYQQKNNPAQAARYAGLAERFNRRNPFYCYAQAEQYLNEHNTSEALYWLRKATRLMPHNPRFHARLSEVYAIAGDHKRAERAMTKARRLGYSEQSLIAGQLGRN